MLNRLRAYNYYDTNPSINYTTGDIWSNLPTYGLLKCSHCTGIVITPSCDLANRKVEALTYLPIVPIKLWLCTTAFYSEARNNLFDLVQSFEDIKYEICEKLPKRGIIDGYTIQKLKIIIDTYKSKIKKQKRLESLDRIQQGLDHISIIFDKTALKPKFEDLAMFMGKKWNSLLAQLVKNSYGSDLHFLPSDEQDLEWSVISSPSLVLFRYPLTAPIEIFDLAQDVQCVNWEQGVLQMHDSFKFCENFAEKKPVKTLKLNTIFLNDLITRYVGLYVRLGSPDFSNQKVKTILSEIER